MMDAPPELEDSIPFVDMVEYLTKHGVAAPRIHALQMDQGLMLLDDFGDETLLMALERGVSPELLYDQAVDTLLDFQATPQNNRCIAHQRPYDRNLLRFELSLFTDWFIEGLLETPISEADKARFDRAFDDLINALLEQPVTLVHRDYHSRNLMWMGKGRGLGVIDFQDAVMGPITYDLASLLRDCYVAWEAPFRRRAMERWLAGASMRLGYQADWETFQRAFDWMALQRNLKAIGIFGRLSIRDGKHGYLADIPRTLGYVRENLAVYEEWSDLAELVTHYVPLEREIPTCAP